MRYHVAVHRPGRPGWIFEARTRKQAVHEAERRLGHPQVDYVEICDSQKNTCDKFMKGEEPK